MIEYPRLPNKARCSRSSRHVPILLVDDDFVEIMSMKRAMNAQNLTNPIVLAQDGEQALEILRGWVGPNSKLPPVLIILDMNIPKMNGLEVLAEIRNDISMKHAVVFVRSTSDLPADVSASYDKNVAGYFLKRNSKNNAGQFVETLNRYVSEVVFNAEPHC